MRTDEVTDDCFNSSRSPRPLLLCLLRPGGREFTSVRKSMAFCRLADVRVTIEQAVELYDARGRRFTAYAITSRLDNAEYTAERRFRDFVALHGALRADCPEAVPKICPLRKFPPKMPSAIRTRVEATRVAELEGYLRRTLEACARAAATPSASNLAHSAGGAASDGLRQGTAAAHLLSSFLEIAADALLPGQATPGQGGAALPEAATAAGKPHGAGNGLMSPGPEAFARADGAGASALPDSDRSGDGHADPERVLRALSDECAAAADGAAAATKVCAALTS